MWKSSSCIIHSPFWCVYAFFLFLQSMQVFVPSYAGSKMVMLKIKDMSDFESLPLTKWNIRQPDHDGIRESANETGECLVFYTHSIWYGIWLVLVIICSFFYAHKGGLDLILLPGVAFTRQGGRMGHGMGYYDKYLSEHFNQNPHRRSPSKASIATKLKDKNTILLGLAFNEQIVDSVPLEETDVLLDDVITA